VFLHGAKKYQQDAIFDFLALKLNFGDFHSFSFDFF